MPPYYSIADLARKIGIGQNKLRYWIWVAKIVAPPTQKSGSSRLYYTHDEYTQIVNTFKRYLEEKGQK